MMMAMPSTTMLYKFRHSSSCSKWSSISLTGSYPRIFDIKRAIVKESGLDRGKLCDFDFLIRNATTGELYDNEHMRPTQRQRGGHQENRQEDGNSMMGEKKKEEGTMSLIVERVPAARGHGLIVRLARADAGLNFVEIGEQYGNPDAARRGFYDYRVFDEDEFVDVHPEKMPLMAVNDNGNKGNSNDNNDNNAVNSSSTKNNNSNISDRLVVAAPFSVDEDVRVPSTLTRKNHMKRTYPDADPELQDKTPRKVAKREPPIQHTRSKAVQEESQVKNQKTLELVLKITATSIPEHYQCGICAGLAKDALFIPWDDEGRTACDHCMRKGLSENRLCCPLTGQDGVNPNDLRPNKALQKAINAFVRGVMKKKEAQDVELVVGRAIDTFENVPIREQKTGGQVGHQLQNSFDDFHFGGDVFCVDKDEEKENVHNNTNNKNVIAEDVHVGEKKFRGKN